MPGITEKQAVVLCVILCVIDQPSKCRSHVRKKTNNWQPQLILVNHFQLASAHALVTLVGFMALGIPLVYFATFLSFLFTIIPVFGSASYAICLPWCIYLVLSGGSGYLYSVLLAGWMVYGFGQSDAVILGEVSGHFY